MADNPTAYLAGPAIFHPATKALFDYLTDVCATHGLSAVAPAHGDAVAPGLSPADQAAAIRRANMDRIKSCQVVIACISPFRGPGADAGTAWEMGYAEALGKPVIAWCEDTTPYLARVPHDRDADGRVFCRQHGMRVEDFGLVDHHMLAAGMTAVQPDFEAAVTVAAQLVRDAKH